MENNNYIWFLPCDEKNICLGTNDFKKLSQPFYYILQNEVRDYLEEIGYQINEDYDMYGKPIYYVIYKGIKMIEFTAPLYKYSKNTCTYELFDERYTSYTIDPELYGLVYELTKKAYMTCCKFAEKNFWMKFCQYSIDNNITSLMQIKNNNDYRSPNAMTVFYDTNDNVALLINKEIALGKSIKIKADKKYLTDTVLERIKKLNKEFNTDILLV